MTDLDVEWGPDVALLVRKALDAIPGASILVLDTHMRYLLVRGAALAKNGFRSQDLEGQLASEALAPARWDFYRPSYEAALAGVSSSLQVVSPDGNSHYEVRTSPLRDQSGAIIGAIAISTDVTDAVTAQRAVAASEKLFRTALESSPVGMALTSLDAHFRVVNPALCTLLGRDREWLLQRSADDVIHPDDLGEVREGRAALAIGATELLVTKMRLVRADGAAVWTKRHGALIRDSAGQPDFLVLQWVDLTAEHEAQERLAYQAFHDPLTGLHNRAWILESLEADLAGSERSGTHLGLLFIDLDGLKGINDSLGHGVGDLVLTAVAHRIKDSLRPDDQVGRIGGDEFVALVPRVVDRAQLEKVAHRIATAVRTEVLVTGHRVVPTVSIGIGVAAAGMNPSDLLRVADAALYRAKSEGRDCWRFVDEVMSSGVEPG